MCDYVKRIFFFGAVAVKHVYIGKFAVFGLLDEQATRGNISIRHAFATRSPRLRHAFATRSPRVRSNLRLRIIARAIVKQPRIGL